MANGKTIELMTEQERKDGAAKEVQAVLDKYHVQLGTAHQIVITANPMPVSVEPVEVVKEEPKV